MPFRSEGGHRLATLMYRSMKSVQYFTETEGADIFLTASLLSFFYNLTSQQSDGHFFHSF